MQQKAYVPEGPLTAREHVMRRLRPPWELGVTLVWISASVIGVYVILLSESPRAEAMPTLVAADVGLLIALAIERFSATADKDMTVRIRVAGVRTVPTSFALLAALIGATVDLQGAARYVAAGAFLLTAAGVAGVGYSALDRAMDPRAWIPPGEPGGTEQEGPITTPPA
jgi:hypothetical protein